ncbi:hypothetical protein AVL55_06595 [Alteromonas macleodii]|uniref:Uncharacterized protein n=1 Tax=Alteromonas macleodii TaxID=28108 RepID=A0A126PYJ1_ALTMA|nr:hypothetical protein AVL55_06595 [Alteromonas macleodii]
MQLQAMSCLFNLSLLDFSAIKMALVDLNEFTAFKLTLKPLNILDFSNNYYFWHTFSYVLSTDDKNKKSVLFVRSK